MKFNLGFESSDNGDEEQEDAVKEALDGRLQNSVKKAARILAAAGVFAAGVYGTDVLIEKAQEADGEVFSAVESAHEKYGPNPSSDEIAKVYIKNNLPDSLANQQQLIDQTAKLLDEYGATGISTIHEAHKEYERHNQTENKEDTVKEEAVRIQGFEKVGISSEELQQLWSEEYYPDGTIDGQIESVTYTDSLYSNSDTTDTHRAADVSWLGKRVRVHRPQNLESLDSYEIVWLFDQSFGHELTHANDWISDVSLTRSERIRFFHDVHETFQESTFRDSVDVKSLNDFQDIDRVERLDMIIEWFAGVGEMYFVVPDSFEEEYPKAYKLADRWLTRDEPDFDPTEAGMERSALYDQLAKTSVFDDL
jgi:hypothetical protein